VLSLPPFEDLLPAELRQLCEYCRQLRGLGVCGDDDDELDHDDDDGPYDDDEMGIDPEE